MNLKKNFLRKLWWDGRMGHSNYLMFFLAFVNFILITYSFLIEGNEIFEQYISDLGLFTVIFLIFYFPVSILIGRWHTKTQISVEMTMKMNEDPIMAKMIRTLLDVQTGKASEEEIAEFRKIVAEIEKQDINEF
ncbi:hypothetical protein NZNM25_19680 [Nitrosopumilus zosterae]|uniref:Uncharacterized protein n=1 Tax=Nitrosopumilus zosterae TaxID=718286 RepID=A0A2S2KUE3_9ARCH|nr:hypothetical protein [Nitrosopumilus zosterae]BDQ31827.1 hypothetical protein NZOSNM25_001965 [Nitrosopumilus zosterae]GBH35177.1 hypothetical protein NZNM25_19680 [Nitrosopumilus zosterae]